jgi:hypothetical protein
VTFLFWLGVTYAVIGGLILAGVNYDRLTVTALSAINAPLYEDARRVAGMIYARPDEWKLDKYGHLNNPTFGTIRNTDRVYAISVESTAFGDWTPSRIERRILANAARWHQRRAIQQALQMVEKVA